MRISASRMGLVLSATVGLVAALVACSEDGKECRVGADCASGQCSADGLCAAPGGSSSSSSSSSSGEPSTSSGGSSGGSTSSSSGSTSSSSSSGSSGTGCVANMDGIITKEEVPQMAGLVGNFRFVADATVNLTGVVESGIRKWDLSGPFGGDYDVAVETKPVAGSWYASGFPTGVYSALLGKAPAEALGVLRPDATSLSLLGIVSNSDSKPSSGETNMVYDVPITTLQFPLKKGSRWQTVEAHGSGKLAGYDVPLYGSVTDTYRSVVDAEGALVTPLGIFPVLRVVTSFHRSSTSWLLISDSTTIVFVTECGGTIAKISTDTEVDVEGGSDAEITAAVDAIEDAVEVQRLAPPL